MNTEKYRWDGATGTLYEYSENHQAYLFACHRLPGETREDVIRRYENDEFDG